MKTNPQGRRDFLRDAGLAVTVLATGSPIIFGANYSWALSTSVFDPHTATTLLVMSRVLFPHDRLGDQYYAAVVEAVDKQAASDAAVKQTLVDGVTAMDAALGLPWLQLSDGARIAVLKSVETTSFFSTMRMATINNLYGNPLVFRHFGYEGSSVEHGGYLDRGFDDIGWLPAS